MPNGYTAPIVESQNEITFEDYARRCVRAFLVYMRDEPMDAEPKPPVLSDYHPKSIERAKERLKALEGLSKEEIEAKTEAFNDRLKEDYESSKLRHAKNKARYETMLAKVEAWEPPTPDHQKFKDFMVRQIKESMEWDLREPTEPTYISASRWFQEEKDNAQSDLKYHQERHAEELVNHKRAHAWVTTLLENLQPSVA